MAKCSALDKIYLSLVRFLNVSNLKPYLKQKQLLTDEELEQLQCTATSQTTAETLIKILKRKGPNHDRELLSALKDSMELDPHQGHISIIADLEEALAKQELTKFMEQPESDEELEKDFVKFGSAKNGESDHETVEPESLKKAALRSKVVKANNEIKMKFTKLVLDVYRLLTKKNVAVEEIRLGLLYLGCFKDTVEKSDGPISSTSQLSYAETVRSLIACLHKYSSWYNYGMIKFIAEEFGGEDGEIIIADYVKHLTSYCERIIACECPEYSLATGLPSGYDQLIVKVDWDHLTCTTQDIAIFQSELSCLLNLKPEIFILKSVDKGCIKISWGVPQAITTHIIVQTMKQQQQLAKLNVLHICTAGKFIEIKKVAKDLCFSNSQENDEYQSSLPSPRTPCDLSEASSLSDNTTMSPGIPYSTADMTPDELEIFSTYSGSRHGSSFSIEAQVSNGNGDFAKTKQFYSEGDILSQDSLQRVCAKRMSLPPEDISAPTSKKKSAKNVLKSMLPKLFRGRAKEESRAIQHRGEIGPEFDSHFPIMELSEEPATKTKGKCTYFYYGGEDHINRSTPVCASSLSSADQTCDSQPECNWNSTGTALGYPEEHNMSCTNKYSSRESGLGSNFSVTNTTSIDNFHHHCVKNDNCVQRSESMRSRYHIPQSGLYHTQKLSQPHHIPSLHSYERVNSPSSSGYCESQSGCSSLYSLGSSVNYSVPLTGGFPCHCEHHTSSSKRNSITSAGGIVTNRSKTSTRSHSFNGKYTIHRETQ